MDPDPRALRPGRYTARVTYFNFPDYGIGGYIGDDVPRTVWEGRLEGAPVSFTVVAPAAAARPEPLPLVDERGVIHLLPRGAEAPTARVQRRFARLRVSPATYALLSRYQWGLLMKDLLMVAPDPTLRETVVRRLVDALATLPPLDRDDMVDTTPWFAAVLSEAPGCSGASLLLRSLHAPATDIVQRLSDPARLIARRCPALRGRLRAMVEAPSGIRPSPGHLTQRRVAVRLLGAIGDPEDVPLLIRLFERRTPNTRATRTDSGILRIAALQAIAEAGGLSAAGILLAHMEEALADPTLAPRVIDVAMRLGSEERARVPGAAALLERPTRAGERDRRATAARRTRGAPATANADLARFSTGAFRCGTRRAGSGRIRPRCDARRCTRSRQKAASRSHRRARA